MIAPAGIRGRPAPARVRPVNDIVVDQRRAVNELDHGSQSHGAASTVTRVTRRQEQQRGPQAFAPSRQQVTGNLRHRLNRRTALKRELLFDLDQVLANQVKDFLGGQK